MDGADFWQSQPSLAVTNLYMFEHKIACDVILMAGEGGTRQQVPAHKFILISRSPVFYTMFCGSLPETGETIDIPDIDSETLTSFLRYLYTGDIEIGPENAMYIMYTAKKYSVKALVDQCLSYLEKEIDVHNACAILEQAHLFDEEDLRNQCMEIILANCKTILTGDETDFCDLCFDCFKKLVGSDKLSIKEEQIYTACIQWAKHKCEKNEFDITNENIRIILGEILNLIRFSKMEKDFLEHHVLSMDILNEQEKSLLYRHIGLTPPIDESDSSSHTHIIPNSVKEKTLWFKPRKCNELNRANRFLEYAGSTLDFWMNDNLPDAVSFSSSRDLHLVGVSIFKPFRNGRVRGSIHLYDESNRCIAKKSNVDINNVSNNDCKFSDVFFQKALQIRGHKWYTVVQQMHGDRSYFGRQGQRQVAGKNVTFLFRKSPMDCNNTDIDSGQIVSLLYR